jgi:hypothetical protein
MGNVRTDRGECRDDDWPLVAGNPDGASPSFFAASSRESLAHLVPGSTDDPTSYNLAPNLSEPFDQPVAVPFQDSSVTTFTATLQQCFEPLDPNFLTSFEDLTYRSTNTDLQFQGHRRPSTPDSMWSYTPIRKPLSRYYAEALSAEDKQALAQGEKNHNLREWSGEDLVTHHDARKGLVPHVMPKVEKSHALAGIEYDKQHSQRALSKMPEKVRHIFRRPRSSLTIDNAKDDEDARAHSGQYSQSTYDLRSSETSHTPSFQEDAEPHPHRHPHARAASNGDYFSQSSGRRTSAYNTRRISPLASTSGPASSNSSTRIGSPLSQEVRFRANPETTFDSFLAPHKSGKGEVFHDSENAMKVKTPKASHSPSPSPNLMAKARRLTKMPSMPLLRRRSSGS